MPSRMLRLLPASLLALVSTVCAAPAFAQPRPAPVTDSLARMNESIDALTRKVWPSVVQVLVTSYGAQPPEARDDSRVVFGRQSSVGSGPDPSGSNAAMQTTMPGRCGCPAPTTIHSLPLHRRTTPCAVAA